MTDYFSLPPLRSAFWLLRPVSFPFFLPFILRGERRRASATMLYTSNLSQRTLSPLIIFKRHLKPPTSPLPSAPRITPGNVCRWKGNSNLLVAKARLQCRKFVSRARRIASGEAFRRNYPVWFLCAPRCSRDPARAVVLLPRSSIVQGPWE